MAPLTDGATAGVLLMLCSPVISNVQVTKTLIDDSAGLNVLSVDTFYNLQVPPAALSVRGATPLRHVPPLRTCHHTTPHV